MNSSVYLSYFFDKKNKRELMLAANLVQEWSRLHLILCKIAIMVVNMGWISVKFHSLYIVEEELIPSMDV